MLYSRSLSDGRVRQAPSFFIKSEANKHEKRFIYTFVWSLFRRL